LELLSEKKINSREFREITSSLNLQVGQLSQFLENLLKWIRNITTEIKPHFEEIPLLQVVEESVGLFAMQAKKKHVKIKTRVSDKTNIYADKEMIKLVLRNLINNAIKFCHEDDRILVEAKESLGEVCISVQDTGQGISKENISKLFEPLYLTTVGTKNEIGTGLGLSLCKEFIEKMGGKISVASEEGEGSKFEFIIHSPTSPSYEFLQFMENSASG
jgi:signal transduction histidine kinase